MQAESQYPRMSNKSKSASSSHRFRIAERRLSPGFFSDAVLIRICGAFRHIRNRPCDSSPFVVRKIANREQNHQCLLLMSCRGAAYLRFSQCKDNTNREQNHQCLLLMSCRGAYLRTLVQRYYKRKAKGELSRLIGTYRDLSGLIETYRDLSGLIGTYRDLSRLIGTYRDLSGLIGTYRDLSGLIGTYRDLSKAESTINRGIARVL
jgi:hypothetical protein